MNTKIVGLTAAAALLTACGGGALSEAEQELADLCISWGEADDDGCRCYAKEVGRRLNDDELAFLTEVTRSSESYLRAEAEQYEKLAAVEDKLSRSGKDPADVCSDA